MKVLCYVNHYFGTPIGFEGRSTDGDPDRRRSVVAECLDGLRRLPGVEVNVCGIAGNALEPIDIDFPHVRDDPKMLVYESLAHMAGRVDRYDYYINIEDDILLPAQTFANVIDFDAVSYPNEILHPNRIETAETGRLFCVDTEVMPGWTYQRRTYDGRELRVARNPHSGVLILSRQKLDYALEHIDLGYRGRFLTYEMDSALAYYHSPFSLYRPFGDLDFHTVTHLDHWAGPRPPQPRVIAPPRTRPRWKRVVRELVPPILLPRRRNH